jgi:hypothetical protein
MKALSVPEAIRAMVCSTQFLTNYANCSPAIGSDPINPLEMTLAAWREITPLLRMALTNVVRALPLQIAFNIGGWNVQFGPFNGGSA